MMKSIVAIPAVEEEEETASPYKSGTALRLLCRLQTAADPLPLRAVYTHVHAVDKKKQPFIIIRNWKIYV